MSESRKQRLKEVAVEETKAFTPVFLYIWILLGVFSLHKSLILSQEHIIERQGFEVLKALAFAKVLFLAEKTPLGRILADRPLVWPVLAKSAVFGVVLLVIEIIEELLIARFLPSHASAADHPDFSNFSILATTLGLMTAALIPFFGLRELGKVFGESEMLKLFFKDRHSRIAILDAGPEPQTADDAAEAEAPQEGQYYFADGQYYYYSGGQYHLYAPPDDAPPRAGAE